MMNVERGRVETRKLKLETCCVVGRGGRRGVRPLRRTGTGIKGMGEVPRTEG
jgi:hypothetical protein